MVGRAVPCPPQSNVLTCGGEETRSPAALVELVRQVRRAALPRKDDLVSWARGRALECVRLAAVLEQGASKAAASRTHSKGSGRGARFVGDNL